MLARKRFSKQKVVMLSGIIIVTWVIIGILFYLNFAHSPAKRQNLTTRVALPTAVPPPTVTTLWYQALNFSLFDSAVFKELKIYGEVPLTAKALGRSNPFVPILSPPPAKK